MREREREEMNENENELSVCSWARVTPALGQKGETCNSTQVLQVSGINSDVWIQTLHLDMGCVSSGILTARPNVCCKVGVFNRPLPVE